MNLPNKLTVVRIILIPFLLIFMLPLSFMPLGWNDFVSRYGMIVALVIFSVASYTDHLDGAIARKHNLVTNLGKFLDPIADKLLVLSVFIAFVELDRISSWVPIIVFTREIAITGLRTLAVEKGKVIAASKLGKLKTVTQIIAIICLMISQISRQLMTVHIQFNTILDSLAYIAVALAVAATLFSGFDYFLKNKQFIQE